jgi:WD40 repeat protein
MSHLRPFPLKRVFVSIIVLYLITGVHSGQLTGVPALAQDSAPAENGPVPQDAVSRLGRGAMSGVALSPDERRLAVITEIGMYMYDATTMQQMWYSEGYDLLSAPVAFSPDSKRLVGGHGGDRLVSWNVETGEILAEYNYQYRSYDAAFSGDGRYVIGGGGSQVVVWDSVTGERIYWKNNSYTLGADTIAASPDGTMFASSGTIASDHFNEIAVWYTANGVIRNTFTVDLPGQYLLTSDLEFTPDNKYLVAAFDGGWIKGWNLETGGAAFTIKSPDGWVGDLNFSADGSRMVVGAYYVHVYRMPTAGFIRSYMLLSRSNYSPWYALDGSLKSMVFGASGLSIIDVESRAEVGRIDGHLSPNVAAALSPDGSTLVMGKYGGRLEVRDVATNTVRTNLKAIYSADSLAFSPDGTKIAGVFLYNWDDIISKVQAWDLATGRLLFTLSDFDHTIGDIMYSPDGGSMLITFSGGLVRRVDARTGETLANYENLPDTGARRILARDGHTVALMTGELLTMWDLNSGSKISEFPIVTSDIPDHFPSFSPSTAVLSPDGTLLAAGESDNYDSATVVLWDVRTGQRLGMIDDGLDHGPFAGIRSIAFSPDMSLLVAGVYDGTILLADARSGQLIRVLQGHGTRVSWVGFLPQTGKLVSASEDGTVVFWQIP